MSLWNVQGAQSEETSREAAMLGAQKLLKTRSKAVNKMLNFSYPLLVAATLLIGSFALGSNASEKRYLGFDYQLPVSEDATPSVEMRTESSSSDQNRRATWVCRTHNDRYVVDGSEERRKCSENGGTVLPVANREGFVDRNAPAQAVPLRPAQGYPKIMHGSSPYDSTTSVQETDRWQHPERFK